MEELSTRWLAPDPGRLWQTAVVTRVVAETQQATTLTLDLGEPPEFLPGQYYLVRLALDSHPWAIEQPYSVSSSPYPPSALIEITVRQVPGGRASQTLTQKLSLGDQIHLRGPFGFLTWSEDSGGPLVLIGAGSGVAPLMSIIRYAKLRCANVDMALICSSREFSSVLFRSELELLAATTKSLRVAHTFTRSGADEYSHFHRRIDAAMINEATYHLRGIDPARVTYLVAGSADMVASTRYALYELGVAEYQIMSEDHA